MRRVWFALAVVALGLMGSGAVPSREEGGGVRSAAEIRTPRDVKIEISIGREPRPSPAVLVPEPALAQQLMRMTNAARAEAGVAPLRWWRDAVESAAKAQTDRMVADQRLYHTPDLDALLYELDAQTVGENVGVGASINALHTAFMKSPKHRANILSEDFRLAAIWVVRDLNKLWVTVTFGSRAR